MARSETRPLGSGGGGDDRSPADINQTQWDQHRGELLRLSGALGVLTAKLEETRRDLRNLSKQMEALVARQSKQSDWRETVEETTARVEVDKLQKELAKFEAKEEKRVALWLKIAMIVFGAAASAAIGHWLK